MEPHYRVTIFGSARISEGDEAYRDVYDIARGLAAEGFDIVTGGGPGLMRAANSGSKSVSNGGQSIGLNIKLPHEQCPNPYLDIKEEFDRFSGRLDAFMAMSDAVVVAPGGIGTMLELFYSWQLVQVQHLCETPIILSAKSGPACSFGLKPKYCRAICSSARICIQYFTSWKPQRWLI